MADTFIRPAYTRLAASSNGVKPLAVNDADSYPGTRGGTTQIRAAFYVTNFSLTEYLYLRTAGGVVVSIIPPVTPLVFELDDDLQVYNPTGNSGSIDYVVAEKFYTPLGKGGGGGVVPSGGGGPVIGGGKPQGSGPRGAGPGN